MKVFFFFMFLNLNFRQANEEAKQNFETRLGALMEGSKGIDGEYAFITLLRISVM